VTEVAIAVVESPVPSPASVRPDLPDAFVRIVMRCLEKRPADRYEDVDDLASALADFAKLPWASRRPSGEKKAGPAAEARSPSHDTDPFAKTEQATPRATDDANAKTLEDASPRGALAKETPKTDGGVATPIVAKPESKAGKQPPERDRGNVRTFVIGAVVMAVFATSTWYFVGRGPGGEQRGKNGAPGSSAPSPSSTSEEASMGPPNGVDNLEGGKGARAKNAKGEIVQSDRPQVGKGVGGLLPSAPSITLPTALPAALPPPKPPPQPKFDPVGAPPPAAAGPAAAGPPPAAAGPPPAAGGPPPGMASQL
jgi:hypothetical protein